MVNLIAVNIHEQLMFIDVVTDRMEIFPNLTRCPSKRKGMDSQRVQRS